GHFIYAKWNGKLEPLCEIVRDSDAVSNVLGLRVADVVLVLFIGLHSPLVGGMRFADINSQKIDVVLVIVVELNDVANLATERRSSEAAEDKHQRAARGSLTNVKTCGPVERNQSRIRRLIAHFQITAMHVWEGIANHVEDVFRAAGHKAQQHECRHNYQCDRNQDPFQWAAHRSWAQ